MNGATARWFALGLKAITPGRIRKHSRKLRLRSFIGDDDLDSHGLQQSDLISKIRNETEIIKGLFMLFYAFFT